MSTFIVLIPIRQNNARKMCEDIENLKIKSIAKTAGEKLERACECVEDALKIDNIKKLDFIVLPITDFMDDANDQEIVLDEYFLSYINII